MTGSYTFTNSLRAMAKIKRVEATTNNLTKGIINTILLAGFSASRINTQGQYVEHLNGYKEGGYRPSGGRNGFSDVCACICGRAVAIEVKNARTSDTMADDQKKFRKEWEAAGGIYYACPSWQDFITWWAWMEKITIPAWQEADRIFSRWEILKPKPCPDGCTHLVFPYGEPARCTECGIPLTQEEVREYYEGNYPLIRNAKQ